MRTFTVVSEGFNGKVTVRVGIASEWSIVAMLACLDGVPGLWILY